MQTGSSETLIGWKTRKTTYIPLWDRVRSLESLMTGQNWFLNQFVEIPRRSIVVCFLSL
jgi:hypothetical protein